MMSQEEFEKHDNDILNIGKPLYTRDGRIIGNTRIVAIEKRKYGTVYRVVTDYGNTCYFTEAEIDEMFWRRKGRTE